MKRNRCNEVVILNIPKGSCLKHLIIFQHFDIEHEILKCKKKNSFKTLVLEKKCVTTHRFRVQGRRSDSSHVYRRDSQVLTCKKERIKFSRAEKKESSPHFRGERIKSWNVEKKKSSPHCRGERIKSSSLEKKE